MAYLLKITHLRPCGGRVRAGHEAADELDPEVVVSEQVAEAARLHHVAGALTWSVLTRERQTALGLAMALQDKEKKKTSQCPVTFALRCFCTSSFTPITFEHTI